VDDFGIAQVRDLPLLNTLLEPNERDKSRAYEA
jgi:hypothetical protein